jgi:hypothetical protein
MYRPAAQIALIVRCHLKLVLAAESDQLLGAPHRTRLGADSVNMGDLIARRVERSIRDDVAL